MAISLRVAPQQTARIGLKAETTFGAGIDTDAPSNMEHIS